MRGRPTKLTDRTAAVVVEALVDGRGVGGAATAAGVSERSLRRWLARGSAEELDDDEALDESRYAQLVGELETALARAELRHLQVLQRRVAAGDWRAAAWLLEQNFPERYGLR